MDQQRSDDQAKSVFFVSENEKFFADTTEQQLRELWNEYQKSETAHVQITFMHFCRLNRIRVRATAITKIAHIVDIGLN